MSEESAEKEDQNKKKEKIVFDFRKIFLVSSVVILFVAGFVFLGLKEPSEKKELVSDQEMSANSSLQENQDRGNGGDLVDTNNNDLEVEEIKVGDGAEATPGKTATVHYTGTLTDGTKFDSSLDRRQPFSFEIGAGQVIRGWEIGVNGMKVGGKRKLTIPPHLAYGEKGAPPAIGPNETLIFEIELLRAE